MLCYLGINLEWIEPALGHLAWLIQVLKPGQWVPKFPRATGYAHLLCVLASPTREKTVTAPLFIVTVELLGAHLFAGKCADDIF